MEHQPVQYRPPAAPERPRVRHVASRIALYYLIFGLLWIGVTHWAMHLLPKQFQDSTELMKGAFFIVLTAALLFLLVRGFVREMEASERDMQLRLQGIAEQYQRLFDRNPMAMIIFDVETRQILAANDVALVLFGYPRAELLALHRAAPGPAARWTHHLRRVDDPPGGF